MRLVSIELLSALQQPRQPASIASLCIAKAAVDCQAAGKIARSDSEATIAPTEFQEEPTPAPNEEALILSEEEQAELKVKAFRNVVQDDMVALGEILDRLSVDVWSTWQNKAGKDLLTLSEERGSSGAYSVLAKRLGLVQERQRESFEERESVWIFLQGEVQPLRATVLEDTPEEADDVLVEYWDGDAPATRMDKCMVRKMWS
ncbi:unnamed protein product [Polarella glacialis]|uniref:Uncharacterized protein n=1 Tax=Polarella glacialis TaxID=89957 RepID=A0A813G7H2_POLGL|nr:unnamed protein product [Polarella glacialis]